MTALFRQLIDWYLASLDKGGYWLVALLMAIESSIVPLPSELVIPPAAYLAHKEGKMSVIGVVIAGALGSWLGATVMYWASRLAGRPIVMRWAAVSETWLGWAVARVDRWPWAARAVRAAGHLVVISPEKVGAAERWSARYGAFGVFFSRVLPVVRHLIGIPAGIVRLDFRMYSAYTLLGSTLWCSVLAWIGIKAGQDEALMRGELRSVTLWAVAILGVLGVIYWFFVHRHMQAEKK